jgi:hypothetical protein
MDVRDRYASLVKLRRPGKKRPRMSGASSMDGGDDGEEFENVDHSLVEVDVDDMEGDAKQLKTSPSSHPSRMKIALSVHKDDAVLALASDSSDEEA